MNSLHGQLTIPFVLLHLTATIGLFALPISRESSFEGANSELEPASTIETQSVEPASAISNETQPNPFAPRPISFVFDPRSLSPSMRLIKLNPTGNINVTCNDGSPIGYYIRRNIHSKSWIIYLQGGGFCGSEESCQLRWQRDRNLMSSNYWPSARTVDGILSSDPKDNPYLWNANHVYVPYCSSDSWTGLSAVVQNRGTYNGEERGPSSFAFMGSKIIERVLDSLYDRTPEAGLRQAKYILLAGDSAGATGVILNLDKVKRYIKQKFHQLQSDCLSLSVPGSEQQPHCNMAKQPPVLRGLADSGWFLDNEPYYPQMSGDSGANPFQSEQLEEDCDRQRCNPLQSIKQAMRHWNGQVPQACLMEYPLEPWRCYFGYRAYPTLRTPLFVVQWLYDEAQLLIDNIARPHTSAQWDHVNKVANEMRVSLGNVTALFAPSCFSHSLITKPNWNQININGLKLPHVLNSWEEQSLLDVTTADEAGKSELVDSNKHNQASSVSNNSLTLPTNQSTLEALTPEHDTSPAKSNIVAHQLQVNSTELRATSRASVQNKSRGRKRKRNNPHQKSKQTRQASTSGQHRMAATSSRDSNDSRESYQVANPLQSILPLIDSSLADGNIMFERQTRSDKSGSGTPSSNGRLGRSALVDDSTLMFGNNMPQEMSAVYPPSPSIYESRGDNPSSRSYMSTDGTNLVPAVTTLGKIVDYNSFRLIDTCSWPQCNRDCPALNIDFNTATMIEF